MRGMPEELPGTSLAVRSEIGTLEPPTSRFRTGPRSTRQAHGGVASRQPVGMPLTSAASFWSTTDVHSEFLRLSCRCHFGWQRWPPTWSQP